MLGKPRTRTAVAGLAIAGLGLLAPTGTAVATDAGPAHGGAADAEPTTARRERSACAEAALVDPRVLHPHRPAGRLGTRITVSYNDRSTTSVFITPNNHATAFDGTYTYVGLCPPADPGQAIVWIFPIVHSPAGKRRPMGVTNCF